jgi:hypothetical protein
MSVTLRGKRWNQLAAESRAIEVIELECSEAEFQAGLKGDISTRLKEAIKVESAAIRARGHQPHSTVKIKVAS